MSHLVTGRWKLRRGVRYQKERLGMLRGRDPAGQTFPFRLDGEQKGGIYTTNSSNLLQTLSPVLFLIIVHPESRFLKKIRGFTFFQIFMRYGRQRWKLKGKIEVNGKQSWDGEEMVFLPLIVGLISIKVRQLTSLPASKAGVKKLPSHAPSADH